MFNFQSTCSQAQSTSPFVQTYNTAVLFSPTHFITEDALSQCAIRKLNLLGDLSPGASNYLDPNTLLADLAPLLHAEGRLSTKFRLNWCLRTCHRQTMQRELRFFDHLAARLADLRPIFKHMRSCIEGQGEKKKVLIAVLLDKVTIILDDEVLGWNGLEWHTYAQTLL